MLYRLCEPPLASAAHVSADEGIGALERLQSIFGACQAVVSRIQ
jgi:hypothetical protein